MCRCNLQTTRGTHRPGCIPSSLWLLILRLSRLRSVQQSLRHCSSKIPLQASMLGLSGVFGETWLVLLSVNAPFSRSLNMPPPQPGFTASTAWLHSPLALLHHLPPQPCMLDLTATLGGSSSLVFHVSPRGLCLMHPQNLGLGLGLDSLGAAFCSPLSVLEEGCM